ncbi:MAG: CCA tRNA nucleotidyltransferase [Thermoplasmata archaeon]
MASGMSDDSDPLTAGRVESEVLLRISPEPGQLERIAITRRRLTERAEEAARTEGIPLARALVAGSAARGTFVRGRLDIDLFLLFPPNLGRDELEHHGLRLAELILGGGEKRYAEHPYLRGQFDGFAVDAVPGFAVKDSSRPQSAVDRTPFHQAYLEQRLTPQLIDQVRLTKQFLRALHVYGADARTGGFSGYLTELLVLRFGALRGFLSEARSWRIPVDLRSNPRSAPRVPTDVALVLDDPVDPERNVASALSRRNLALVILAAVAYLRHPTTAAFELPPTASLARDEALRRVAERGTHVSALTLDRPTLVDDILYPQLRKAERAVSEEAERSGFRPIGTSSGGGDNLVILIEVEADHLPAVRQHLGPPAGVDRTGDFLAKWTTSGTGILQGPYLTTDGRLAVETLQVERRFETVMSRHLAKLPLGRDLTTVVRPATAFRSLAETEDSPELQEALAELLSKQLPQYLVSRG